MNFKKILMCLKKEKNNYYLKILQNESCTKNIWHLVNQFRKSKKFKIPIKSLKVGNKITDESQDIVETFLNLFDTTFNKDNSSTSNLNVTNNFSIQNSMQLFPTHPKEI